MVGCNSYKFVLDLQYKELLPELRDASLYEFKMSYFELDIKVNHQEDETWKCVAI
jgi:hypothetical protein